MTRLTDCKAILAIAPALALLLATSPALADVKAGVEAWSRGDYDAALREWRGPAEQGDPDALFNMAQAYKLGRSVKQDLGKAEQLFAQAAGKGHLQAADNYGLLLFQRGERESALPYIVAASGRGDPRAQYLLGLAYFNGDGVPKDWVRAYALVSLAHQAELPQAAKALAEMDTYIPIEQRQQSVALATSFAAQAAANRARQFTSADLNATIASTDSVPYVAAIVRDPPSMAGADYTRPPRAAAESALPAPTPAPASAKAAAAPSPAIGSSPTTKSPAAKAPVTSPASGPWRVQLGAFGVPGNAETLWKRVKDRPELARHAPQFVRNGKLTFLHVSGFASREQAQAACKRLSAAGFDCLTGRN